MRFIFAALALSLCTTPTLAADPTAPVDLVAKFVLGADANATLSLDGGKSAGTLTKASPGNFSATPAGGTAFAFAVTEKTKCVFDIVFSQGGATAGGIEVDATKLQAVTYDTLKQNDNWADYKVTLTGQPGVVQAIGPGGQLAPIPPQSQLSTSLTTETMQAALAELQKTACPAAA
jgi:hypothetical protein